MSIQDTLAPLSKKGWLAFGEELGFARFITSAETTRIPATGNRHILGRHVRFYVYLYMYAISKIQAALNVGPNY